MRRKFPEIKKFVLPILLIAVFSIAGAVFVVNAGTEHNVRGYLWSGTNDSLVSGNTTGVGWISVNDLNSGGATNYGISIPDGDGSVTGYAWSENIGWVDFQPSGGYPAEPSFGVQRKGNDLVGWARILSIKDAQAVGDAGGWEGWIKLSGTTSGGSSYGVKIDPTILKLSGYAWSDELGWINFNNNVSVVPLLTCTFSASPKQIIKPGKSTLEWNCTNANNCSITPSVGNVPNRSTLLVQPTLVQPDKTTKYNLTCDGGVFQWTTVTVLKPGYCEINPSGDGCE